MKGLVVCTHPNPRAFLADIKPAMLINTRVHGSGMKGHTVRSIGITWPKRKDSGETAC